MVDSKKRKHASVVIHQTNQHDSPNKKTKTESQNAEDIDTSRPTALFKPTKARDWTVSIALPGSWLLNAKKPDHKTMQVGRIARAAAVFCVDEIVVFDDNPSGFAPNVVSERYTRGKKSKSKQAVLDAISEEDEPWQNPDQFLYHVLAFAECPPHLRYSHDDPALSIFQKHKNLEWAGTLPSMDMPHHLRPHEWSQFREGVVAGPADPPVRKNASKPARDQQWVHVNCGLPAPVVVPVPPAAPLEPAMRTTVRFANPAPPPNWPHLTPGECAALDATACAASLPREEAGYYWGYSVRKAASLSAVFGECEFADGYDFTVGTSERGVDVRSLLPSAGAGTAGAAPAAFKHLLLVFGGVAGIEPAVANDPVLAAKGLGKGSASELFDAWVNVVPGQGSRTIRTEEAVEFALCALKPYVDSMYEK
ncbi:putative RNA methyltransferase [Boeremia exigua]|uniref:putative RNA methyltransferase n=1 Tax=Boeremia exigua TaxID=749465 RepID=UPI001E8D33F9|nr:putative RNA methyltransferase [Boeremia exigua]KAH6619934.1 putative RNA methyltransferase [Boeremia exigua]